MGVRRNQPSPISPYDINGGLCGRLNCIFTIDFRSTCGYALRHAYPSAKKILFSHCDCLAALNIILPRV